MSNWTPGSAWSVGQLEVVIESCRRLAALTATVPSASPTSAFGRAVPWKVGVVTLVMWSVCEGPESRAVARGGAGGGTSVDVGRPVSFSEPVPTTPPPSPRPVAS